MDLLNSFLNLVVPPASMVMVAFAWPTLCFINACEKVFRTFCSENMEDKVVIITGASSGIGEQIAYEYAKRGTNLVLVARREYRLWGISENARQLGAKHVMVIAADVVKEGECRRFVEETVNYYGRVDHLVNTASLGHTFLFEETADTSVFPHMMDINFWGNVYPTYVALPYLRQSNGRIIVNASVESWLPMPRMSLYAVPASGGRIEEFAKLIVSGACRGDAYVKYPSWYDTFMMYRVFTPDILRWTFQLLLATEGSRRTTSYVGTGRPLLEASSPGKLNSGPLSFAPLSPPRQNQLKLE
ncbi:hypothetical protein IFM89_009927 [Coptis chinensis]|uniref:Uncharacterized protein n=1 Tax=Coptis chinensis TaxID=261450 RepID=A0A835M2Q5_9MAGN|nr:hypothetical protein IFM89_009927 [Coptis chinensis]